MVPEFCGGSSLTIYFSLDYISIVDTSMPALRRPLDVWSAANLVDIFSTGDPSSPLSAFSDEAFLCVVSLCRAIL